MAAGERTRKGASSEGPSRKSSGRVSFPHRMSLDITDEQYEWLKEASWQNRVSASGFLRLIIDRLMTDERQVSKLLKKQKSRGA